MASEKSGSASKPGARGRVLVLLDGSRLSLASLEVAADIAAGRGTELLGVYVEEVNLLRCAGYGFAQEVGASSGICRPMNASSLELRMRTFAEQARRSLEKAVAKRGLSQTLNVSRGRVIEQVLSLAGPEDLLVLGRAGWSAISGSMLGSTARGLIRQAPGDVLLWTELRQRPRSRVVVLLNDEQGANHRAITAGMELAKRHHQPLTVLVRSREEASKAVVADIESRLQGEGLSARVRLIPRAGALEVARCLREEGAAQLVVSRECSLFRDEDAERLLVDMNLPVTVTP